MKQTLAELKGEIDTSIKIVGDFSTLFSIIGIITRQDQKGNRRLEQHYRPIRPNRHTQSMPSNNSKRHFFLSSHGTFSRICQTTKQGLINFKRLKSYKVSFPITIEIN